MCTLFNSISIYSLVRLVMVVSLLLLLFPWTPYSPIIQIIIFIIIIYIIRSIFFSHTTTLLFLFCYYLGFLLKSNNNTFNLKLYYLLLSLYFCCGPSFSPIFGVSSGK